MDDRTKLPLIDLPQIDEDALRSLIERRLDGIGKELKWLSRQIGRNETYMQQYIRYRKPKKLPRRERHLAAQALGFTADALSDITSVESPQPQGSLQKGYRISPANHGFDITARVTTDADIRNFVHALNSLRKIISL